jgi:dipeptide transport system permease protein
MSQAPAALPNVPSNVPPATAPVSQTGFKAEMREFWYFFSQNRGAVGGLVIVSLFVLIAILAPLIAPYDPTLIHEGVFTQGPAWAQGGSAKFLFGTDDVGRDVFSRLIYGARISMGVGFMVVVFSLSIGTLLGLLAGYLGGWVDTIIMRAMDILMALPSILLAIVVVTILGQNLANAVIAVGIVVIPGFVRLVRDDRKKPSIRGSIEQLRCGWLPPSLHQHSP